MPRKIVSRQQTKRVREGGLSAQSAVKSKANDPKPSAPGGRAVAGDQPAVDQIPSGKPPKWPGSKTTGDTGMKGESARGL